MDKVRDILKNCEWHAVKKAWMEDEERSKLGMKNPMEGGCSARCVQVARKELR